ncbi:beta-glucoside-specific PTS transporter subunit IIABC [Schleiferilactobacillus perolens]|uniref:PTS system, beta-glucoside-specific, IIABC component n=1 Tax=Schleiferilactobacillus perolens DSM 12744 TaxID=1423792 RepID=A0A0R1N3X2_9LACO|nr:beta-glucoside-specific PTS transporter subunit IIABC [Schleiferilactobacillus perolens]KRL14425.1 PTS system, beta-glucoside-specific, IIABC component [Schleiferilactobacillus perolens DSM 12744]
MVDSQKLASFIIKNVGGPSNISSVTHCMTRLRFVLHDYNKPDPAILETSPDILTAQTAPGQYQVVIGTGVAAVYDQVMRKLGLSEEAAEKQEPKGALNKLIAIITKSITPVLGILTASGLLQGILALLVATHVVSETNGAYIILHALGQAAFYFFPVILGYTSAKAFGLKPFVGLLLGATLVLPELTSGLVAKHALYTLFSDTIFATKVYKTFFGIPILFPQGGYASTVIPILFITFFASKVQKVLQRVIPEILSHNLNDFLTILIAGPISMLVIGPVTNVLGVLITNGVEQLYAFAPLLAAIVVALLYQPLVILGLHWALTAVALANMGSLGYDFSIFPMTFTANFAQTAIVLAVFLKTRDKNQKALAIPAMISGLFCIIEPAIYGFSLPVKKRFVFSMLGGMAGGIIMALAGARQYAFSFGVLGFVSYINPKTGSFAFVWIALLATAVTFAVSFLLTYFTFSETSPVANGADQPLLHNERIAAPVAGTVEAISNSTDKVFASGSMGKGILLHPTNNEIVAPVSGTVTAVAGDGHAIGLTTASGTELLIHFGINTAELKGECFKSLVTQGQTIKRGEPLAQVDFPLLAQKHYSTETYLVVPNSKDFLDILPTTKAKVKAGDDLLTVIPFNHSQETAVAQ